MNHLSDDSLIALADGLPILIEKFRREHAWLADPEREEMASLLRELEIAGDELRRLVPPRWSLAGRPAVIEDDKIPF